MKRFFVLAFMLVSFLSLSCFTTAHAYPDIYIGQSIQFGNGPGTTNGGEFIVYPLNSTNELFRSFCLETNEYLNFSSTFIVNDISTEARNGGYSGGSPDPISWETAYLYHNFYWGTLGGYDHSDTKADDLQKAIWYLEGESGGVENYYVTLAQGKVSNKEWVGLGDVRVINLVYTDGRRAQDQLTVAPVPEPATMLLLGAGLIGLAGLGRKKLKTA
jgi:hypothetical protein